MQRSERSRPGIADKTAEKVFPAAQGYEMPAEWERHEATWLAWPHNPEHWDDLSEVERIYDRMVCVIAESENVYILIQDEPAALRIQERLTDAGANLGNVFFFYVGTQDVWVRDYGPTFVVNRAAKHGLSFVRWSFNAWGRKYPDLELDDVVPDDLSSILNIEPFTPGIVLEGGSIDVNGKGLLLTTEQCLLNANRNPKLDRVRIEETLCGYLGAKKVIWLGDGIDGDDTDGHVDDVARFVDENTVLAAVEEDPKDANHAPLKENLKRLRAAEGLSGKKLDVLTLPMPRPLLHAGARRPASYANFYITNGAVIVPTFGQPSDAVALEIIARCFPKRRVAGIRCEALVTGCGAIHCVTQQQPLVS